MTDLPDITDQQSSSGYNSALLTFLSPAETLILLEGKDSAFNELLKLTLMNLVLKHVLSVRKVVRQPNPSDHYRVFNYFSPGINFKNYDYQGNEYIFLSPFIEGGYKEILLRNLVRLANDQVMSSGLYRSLLIQNRLIAKYFRQNFIQKLLGTFSLTNEGKKFRAALVLEFDQTSKDLRLNLEDDPEKASIILKSIGGNIFLYPEFNFALLHDFDTDLYIEMHQTSVSLTDLFERMDTSP